MDVGLTLIQTGVTYEKIEESRCEMLNQFDHVLDGKQWGQRHSLQSWPTGRATERTKMGLDFAEHYLASRTLPAGPLLVKHDAAHSQDEEELMMPSFASELRRLPLCRPRDVPRRFL